MIAHTLFYIATSWSSPKVFETLPNLYQIFFKVKCYKFNSIHESDISIIILSFMTVKPTGDVITLYELTFV